MQTELAVLGGGCFWCLEALFQEISGVVDVENGYCGGHVDDPTYEQVCQGNTGHAEVVAITFDPSVVSFRALLELFFTFHDPTTLNRQGDDVGSQYRSVIFYQTPQQRNIAAQVMTEMAQVWDAPIVTALAMAPHVPFYKADASHQNYYRQHPDQSYCALVITPKLIRLRELLLSKSV